MDASVDLMYVPASAWATKSPTVAGSAAAIDDGAWPKRFLASAPGRWLVCRVT